MPRKEEDHGSIPIVRDLGVVDEVGLESGYYGGASGVLVGEELDVTSGDLQAAGFPGIQEEVVECVRVIDASFEDGVVSPAAVLQSTSWV
jgi:hypothetical protein